MSIMFCWWTSNFFMVESSERWEGMIRNPSHASHGPSFKVSAVPAQKHGRQLQEASLKLRNPLWYPKFDHHFHNFRLGGYTSYTLFFTLGLFVTVCHEMITVPYLIGKSDATGRFSIAINCQKVSRNIDHEGVFTLLFTTQSWLWSQRYTSPALLSKKWHCWLGGPHTKKSHHWLILGYHLVGLFKVIYFPNGLIHREHFVFRGRLANPRYKVWKTPNWTTQRLVNLGWNCSRHLMRASILLPPAL